MNSASSDFSGDARSMRSLSAVARRGVLRDVERVAQLVRHHDRADALEIPQLDDLVVDGDRRDRIEPGRRLVVEQDPRLGRHRPRDRHAAALPAGELRRLAIDVLRETDEAEHLFHAAVRLLERHVRTPRTACSRRSRAPSASRRARPPGTPCRGRRGPASADPRSCCPRARRSRRSGRRPASAARGSAAGSSTCRRRSRPGRSSCAPVFSVKLMSRRITFSSNASDTSSNTTIGPPNAEGLVEQRRPWRAFDRHQYISTMSSFVTRKLTTRTATDPATTAFVVARPTPCVPPRVRRPDVAADA